MVWAAEFGDDFGYVAVIGNWGEFQHIRQRELEFAVSRVFFQKVVEDSTGFRGKPGEEGGFVFFYAIRPLAAGENGGIEGQMAQEVKRVGVGLACLQGHLLEINAALGQLLDDFGTLAGVGPTGAQFVRAGAKRPDFFGGVVGKLDDAELFAVGVEFMDQFGGNFDLAAVKVIFATPLPCPLLERGGEGFSASLSSADSTSTLVLRA